MLKLIGIVSSLVHYDLPCLGGGNAANTECEIPGDVYIASKDTGITGGIHLWDPGYGTPQYRCMQPAAVNDDSLRGSTHGCGI